MNHIKVIEKLILKTIDLEKGCVFTRKLTDIMSMSFTASPARIVINLFWVFVLLKFIKYVINISYDYMKNNFFDIV